MKKWMVILMAFAFTGAALGQRVIDGWYYDGVADGTAINGTGCGSVSNSASKWPARSYAVVSNQMQRYTSPAAVGNDSSFNNRTPSDSAAVTTGIFEFSYDIKVADFSLTSANDGSANVAYLIRGKSGSGAYDNGIRLRYEGGLDVTNVVGSVTNVYADADQFQLQVRTADLGGWTVITNLPGSTLTDLNLRVVYDLDAKTNGAYFTLGGGSEVLLHAGTVQADWGLTQIRQAIQMTNGGNSWQPGDIAMIDNIQLSELAAAEPPPAYAVMDFWDYEDNLATTNLPLSAGVSTGYIGGASFPAADVAVITNNMVQWSRFDIANANESAFRSSVPTVYGGSVTGIYEMSWDVVSSDFANTQAAVSNANFGIGIRNKLGGNDDIALRVQYVGSENEFRLQLTDDAANNATLATFAGNTLSNLSIRLFADLDNSGTAGSLSLFYTLGNGPEIAATYNGVVPAGFSLDEYRIVVQTSNGGNGWQLGDYTYTDNLKYEKVVAMPQPPVYFERVNYQMNDAAGTLMDALAQTGSDGGQFSATDANIVTDGLGSLVYSGVTTNDIYRTHVLDVAYTSGLHRLEFAFDDWNLDATENASSVKFGLQDDAGKTISFGIDVNTNNTTVRFRAAASGGSSGQDYYDYSGYIASTGVVMRIDVNLEAGTYTAQWRYDTGTDDDFITAGGGSIGDVSNIARIQLASNAGADTGMDPADYVNTDYLVYSTTSDQSPPSHDELWLTWLGGYSLGADTNMLDDADVDGYDNLSEYYYGGDPSVGGTLANAPALGDQVADGGTNYILYVFTRRQDQDDRGLSSVIELKDNLVYGTWTNDTSLIEFVGAGNVDDTWRAVTNRINAEAGVRFIRNEILFTP